MINFKGLLLAVCFVTALGLNTKRNANKRIENEDNFNNGIFCQLTCKNEDNIIGRTAKCLVKHRGKVHTTLVRNQAYGTWLFYALSGFSTEEKRLCEGVVAGDAFLKNHTHTICPSSMQYVENYAILDLRQKQPVRDPSAETSTKTSADTSNTDDNDGIKILINELDKTVNQMLRKIVVTNNRFAHVDKRASAAARKVVTTMNHLKKELGLLEFGGNDILSTDFPPDGEHKEKENRKERLHRKEEYNNTIKVTNKRSDHGNMIKRHVSTENYNSTRRNDAAELVSALVKMVKNLLHTAGDWPIRPAVCKTQNTKLPRDEKGFSHIAPPYNPTDLGKQRHNPYIKKNELSYIAPPTFFLNNPTEFKNRHESEQVNKEDDWPTLPSIPEKRVEDISSLKNKSLSKIAPPTFPPYNPTDFKNRHESEETHKEDDWFTLPSVPKKRVEDISNHKKKGLSKIAPPTFPPYNPTDFKNRHESEETHKEDDWHTLPSVPKKRDEGTSNKKLWELSKIAPPAFPPYNPTDFKNRHEPERDNKEDDWPTLPSVSKIRDSDPSSHKKKGLFKIAPPTFPPYNPTDFKNRHESEETHKEGDWPTLPSVPKKRDSDPSNHKKKGLSNIAPPTFPPHNPNDSRHEHVPKKTDDEGDMPTQSRFVKNRVDTENSTNSLPHSISSLKKRNGGNNENDVIRKIRVRLEELKNEYKRSGADSLKGIVENLDKEISQVENIKKRTAAEPESAYSLLLPPIVEAVARSVDDVKRNSQTSKETYETLSPIYHALDSNNMDALCRLMNSLLCDNRRLLHCKESDTCCWAYIDPSACSKSDYNGFQECYSELSNILDTLMT